MTAEDKIGQDNVPVPNTKLKQARIHHRWTHARLAEQLEIADPRTISRWERGVASPNPHSRKRLCDLFGMSEAELGLVEEERELIHQADSSTEPESSEVAPSHQQPLKSQRQLFISINRQYLLKRVRAIWITGILEHALYQADCIELELQEQPDTLAKPFRLIVQELGPSEYPPASGIPIEQVYDRADGKLLILGEPGAGKTTLLLKLTRELLDRAEHDPTHLLPVVFHLSSWAAKRYPLTTWLIEELEKEYRVPRQIGQTWINNDQILLLLDGLDEVAQEHRVACVKAINTYCLENHLVPIVICSRTNMYLNLNQASRLFLHKAMVIQDLTTEQIDAYLAAGGKSLESLCSIFHDDPELQEMVKTPLMLNIVALAYQGRSVDDLVAVDSPETRRHQVFERYIQRMLQRPRSQTHYTPEQIRHWLTWLARQMAQRNLTHFYIEHMQPDWLLEDRWMQTYERFAVQLIGGLIGVLVGLLSAMSSLSLTSPYALTYMLIGAVVGWLLGRSKTAGSSSNSGPRTCRTLRPSVVKFRHLISFLLVGLMIGYFTPLTPLSDPQSHLLSFTLVGVLLNIFLAKGKIARRLAEMLIEFWMDAWYRIGFPPKQSALGRSSPFRFDKDVIQRIEHVYNGLAIGLIIGVSFGLGVILNNGQIVKLEQKVSAGVLYGLSYGLSFGLSGFFLSILLKKSTAGIHPAEKVILSWKSLRSSITRRKHLRNAGLVGLLYWLCRTFIWVAPLVLWKENIALWNVLSGDQGVLVLSFALSLGMAYWLLLGFLNSVTNDKLSKEHRFWPNQGIWLSAQNSGLVGLISGFVGCLSYALSVGVGIALIYMLHKLPIDSMSSVLTDGLSYGLNYTLTYGLGPALIFGLTTGLLCGLLNGGWACLQHLLLRFLLWRSGCGPWNYPRFLNDADTCLLLRKEGGGYAFRHQLLLDHFFASATPYREQRR